LAFSFSFSFLALFFSTLAILSTLLLTNLHLAPPTN
jgi:hypothetical protein